MLHFNVFPYLVLSRGLSYYMVEKVSCHCLNCDKIWFRQCTLSWCMFCLINSPEWEHNLSYLLTYYAGNAFTWRFIKTHFCFNWSPCISWYCHQYCENYLQIPHPRTHPAGKSLNFSLFPSRNCTNWNYSW